MKKVILTFVFLVLGFSSLSLAEDDYDFNYSMNYFRDYYDYTDYEFRHIDDETFFDQNPGKVYYYHHSIPGLYFVIAGSRTYIAPRSLFQRYLTSPGFFPISQSDFIRRSRGALGHYDSYIRFNYYYNFYLHYPWNLRNHYRACWNYRYYYGDRYHNNGYFQNYARIMQSNKYRKPIYKSGNNHYSYQKKEASTGHLNYMMPKGHSSNPKVEKYTPFKNGQRQNSYYNQGCWNNYNSNYNHNQRISRKHCHIHYYIKPKPVPPGLIVNRYDLLRKHQPWHNGWWHLTPFPIPICKNGVKPGRTYNNSGSYPKAYGSQSYTRPRKTFNTSYKPSNNKSTNSQKNSHRIRLRRR
jgi:hypothetical protein